MTGPGATLDTSVARLLTIGTYVSVGLVAVGTALLVGGGRSPLDLAPPFDPARLVGDVVGLQPAGFLWLGILGVLATPAARVIAALVGYLRAGEREMVAVAVLILLVIAAGVLTGTAAS